MKDNSFIACFHKYVWFYHLATFITRLAQKGGQVTKPIIIVKTCYKTILYFIQVVWNIFDGDFLASADTKAFGRTQVGLLLIGLALFYTQGVF